MSLVIFVVVVLAAPDVALVAMEKSSLECQCCMLDALRIGVPTVCWKLHTHKYSYSRC